MPETPENSKDIISLLKEYVSTRIELGRLTLAERAIVIIANLLTDTILIISLILTFLFGCVALGFYLGELLHSNAKGFGLVTLLFLVIALIIYFIKDGVVERVLHNFMVKRIFRNKKND